MIREKKGKKRRRFNCGRSGLVMEDTIPFFQPYICPLKWLTHYGWVGDGGRGPSKMKCNDHIQNYFLRIISLLNQGNGCQKLKVQPSPEVQNFAACRI